MLRGNNSSSSNYRKEGWPIAILNNLIVNGSARILGKLYVNDIDVGGTASFDSISTTTLTSIGTITAGTNLYANGGYLYLNNKLALNGSDSWLRINPGQAFTSGVYLGTSIVRTDGTF